MKKTVIVIIAVVVVVFGAIYLFSDKVPQQAAQQNTSATTSTQLGFTTTSATSSATSTSWQQYAGNKKQFIVSYPPGWSIGTSGPVSFDNFNHEYGAGSVIPPGGAEIDIATTQSAQPVSQLAASQLTAAKITSTNTIAVSKASCSQYIYTSTYAPGIPSANSAVYCRYKGTTYEFYLSYRAGDSQGPEFLVTFNQFLGKTQFTQ